MTPSVPQSLLSDDTAPFDEPSEGYGARPTSFAALRNWARPRAVGLLIALAIELLLLLALLTLGSGGSGVIDDTSLVRFSATDYAGPISPEPEPEQPKAKQPAEKPPAAPVVDKQTEPPVEPVVPVETPRPPVAIELPRPTVVPVAPPAPAQARPAPPAPAAAPVQGPVQGPMGPPNTGGGGGGAGPDTQRVGTMPGGEPLYAAAWYREPLASELSGYLSTASGPGWGLIACRTAPDWKVVDCVMLDESPKGSNIARSALAAAWQFKVRPPRVGGKVLMGEWVRIRIDYGVRPRV